MAELVVTIVSPALRYYVVVAETVKQTVQAVAHLVVIHGAAAAALTELEHIPVVGHKVQAAVVAGITEVVQVQAAAQV
jgi:hypothetical protein